MYMSQIDWDHKCVSILAFCFINTYFDKLFKHCLLLSIVFVLWLRSSINRRKPWTPGTFNKWCFVAKVICFNQPFSWNNIEFCWCTAFEWASIHWSVWTIILLKSFAHSRKVIRKDSKQYRPRIWHIIMDTYYIWHAGSTVHSDCSKSAVTLVLFKVNVSFLFLHI